MWQKIPTGLMNQMAQLRKGEKILRETSSVFSGMYRRELPSTLRDLFVRRKIHVYYKHQPKC